MNIFMELGFGEQERKKKIASKRKHSTEARKYFKGARESLELFSGSKGAQTLWESLSMYLM